MATVNEVVSVMAKQSKSFASTHEFGWAELRAACDSLGTSLDVKVIKFSEKLGRGLYRYTGSNNAVKVAKPKAVQRVEVVEVVEAPALATKVTHREAVQANSTFSRVPSIDPTYVPFGDFSDIEKIIKSSVFYPLLITGHSGNGKTLSVEQACAKIGRPLIRINCTKKTDEEVLIGSKTLINGNVEIVEGPMLIAMRSGAVLLLDEISCSDPGAIMCIQGIMEGKPFYFPLSGEYIVPAKGFNVIMTDNTKGQGSDDGRYIGTNILNEAFLERIGMVIEQEFPTTPTETKIVLRRMETKNCVDEKFAAQLVKWAQAIRATFKVGGIDALISTRRLGHIVDNYAIFGDQRKSIVQCTNRFDDLTKVALVTLWDKMSVPLEFKDAK